MNELSHLNTQTNEQELKRLEDEKEALKKQQRRMQHQKQNSEGQMAQFERVSFPFMPVEAICWSPLQVIRF